MKRKSIISKQKKLLEYFEKAGFTERLKINKYLFIISGLITIIASILLFFKFNNYEPRYLIGLLVLVWTFGFATISFICFAIFHFYIDLRIYNRKIEIEKVLPEYLLLSSSNIRAGMMIDQALWYAIRPKFGVLAKEMEQVSKEVLSGKELKNALREFSVKYDSAIVKRTVDLIIEGMDSGGKIADILNRIAENLSEMEIQKKEMAASVMSYVLFIGFAAVGAAPVLMGLAGQLLQVIKGLTSTLADSMGSNTSAMSFMKFSVPELSQSDFLTFTIVMLSVTSFFSAIIIAAITKGEIKQGLKYIPIFLITSISIFLIANYILGIVFSSIFIF